MGVQWGRPPSRQKHFVQLRRYSLVLAAATVQFGSGSMSNVVLCKCWALLGRRYRAEHPAEETAFAACPMLRFVSVCHSLLQLQHDVSLWRVCCLRGSAACPMFCCVSGGGVGCAGGQTNLHFQQLLMLSISSNCLCSVNPKFHKYRQRKGLWYMQNAMP